MERQKMKKIYDEVQTMEHGLSLDAFLSWLLIPGV